MSEVKYEMIFGDQSLFDGAPEDVDMIGYSGGFYKNSPDGPMYCCGCTFTTDEYRNKGFIAMRRIIKEPNRWTWEDKKAGRLPEVGAKCRQGHKDEIVVAVTEKFVVTECQDMSVCTTRKDVFMRSYNPIETPEEKARRLRSEWVESVMNLTPCADASMFLITAQENQTKRIYDALLSAELKAPTRVDQS